MRRSFVEYTYEIVGFGVLTKQVFDAATQAELDATLANMQRVGAEVVLTGTREGAHEAKERVLFPGRPFQRTITEWHEVAA